MNEGRDTTATSNVSYDLVSIMYHALQGAETYEAYAKDADKAGDRELARFMRDVQEENRHRARRAQELLMERWGSVPAAPASASAAAATPDTHRADHETRGAQETHGMQERRGVTVAEQEIVAAPTETTMPARGPASPTSTDAEPHYQRGYVAGSDERYANRSFEDVEPDLRRAYETERTGADPWERLREQVRDGFDRAREREGARTGARR
ncbi:MAG: hypothetical protein ACRDJN_25400 [Chloroflexota bacterium]